MKNYDHSASTTMIVLWMQGRDEFAI